MIGWSDAKTKKAADRRRQSHILFPAVTGAPRPKTLHYPTLPVPRKNSEVVRYFGLDMCGCDLEKAASDVNNGTCSGGTWPQPKTLHLSKERTSTYFRCANTTRCHEQTMNRLSEVLIIR
jgi:hypothetical protein